MPDTLYDWGLAVAAAMMTVSFLVIVWRIITGPNSLDRLVSMDGFVAAFQCALATYICWSLDTTVVNAMLVIALLGFISTVAVTRFRRRDNQ
ncbi:monovalent cation/H+ antiporter complex subunit F [Corynebacterium phoceense]|uniref:monovalent cation/H+ antiporter complex subunit F n=1 Tax=Corynebacterium phoceense TaxID=1686286 RepID=UPI00211B7623|nr:monovalent cation/H+ antiporter complex subunit F [Corynebacterium phoceense]MCQ9331111.1 monovalent cation/H+ antiporter complex subunit F [Corynebacterium phoceense]MCQ9347508.1 monovalent cation/H+ antiporter complex subunit F [Corynebacterium phoceense]